MRQITATEKYNAVLEGKMAKKEFVRQMRQSYPMYVSNFDGFDSTVQILKTHKLLFEAAKISHTEKKAYDENQAATVPLDALDRGTRIELEAAGVNVLNPAKMAVDDYKKAYNKALANLKKDPNHYINLMSGESNKVDKHDKAVEIKRGAATVDTFNGMKKATLKEEVDTVEPVMNDDEPQDLEMSEDAKKNLLGKVVGALRAKYPDVTAGIIKDFIKMHGQDLLDGADTEEEFKYYIDANYKYYTRGIETDPVDLGKMVPDVSPDFDIDQNEYNTDPNTTMYIDDDEWEEEMRGVKEKKADKDYDGDGKIESPEDEYKGSKDKAIKKAMGKEKQLKEAIKSIIKKTLINEAATVKLSDWAESYETFPGVKPVVNELENIVTEIETFYDKMSDKIANVFEKSSEFENEEGLKIGGFIAPGLESAFKQDLSKVIKKGSFFKKINLPKVRTISQADVDAHNSGERPLGETEILEEPKSTVFTPNF